MNKFSKIIKGGVIAAALAVIISGSAFAGIKECVGNGKKYNNLEFSTGNAPASHPVKCVRYKDGNTWGTIYGKTSADCAQAGTITSDPDACKSEDLNNIVNTIINTVIFVIGMVAVVMIILGGISYATSQGDASKVKKGKDTILYGIIGLVIAILAFAIVNFVLGALAG